jgi:hypothetical protein
MTRIPKCTTLLNGVALLILAAFLLLHFASVKAQLAVLCAQPGAVQPVRLSDILRLETL